MKIIDLLNMISKGEEVPKRVSINGGIHGIDTWVYDEHYEDYINGADEMLLNSGMTSNHLNDEVEILEKEKKIPEKICTNRIINTKDILEFEMIQNKINAEYTYAINEIIDYLDYLKSKGE